MDPDVGQIDQGDERHARRHIFAGLDIALIDLRGDRRVDDQLIDDRLNALDIGIGLFDIGLGDRPFFPGVAVDGLFVGRFGLIDGALGFVQRVGHLVEARLRRVALRGQGVGAVEAFLRQHQGRLRALKLRLPRGDDLRPGPDQDVGKLGIGNGHCRFHLFELGDRLRIIDADEHSLCRNILAALDGDFLDPSVDARGDVEPRRIDLALHKQRDWPQQIEEGKRNNDRCDGANDD